MGSPPDPRGAGTLDELTERLRLLRAWAGLGYHAIHRGVVELRQLRGIPERLAYNTVYRCFQPGRSRLDVELVVDIAHVLLGDGGEASAVGAVAEWRLAHQVIAGRATAAGIVSASPVLPDDLAEFTGRHAELARVVGGIGADGAERGPAVWVIEGMAGVGKTMLAVHAGHRLLRRGQFGDLQLSANLRGYDPVQPPADPSAVLGAFLRILGVPGDRIYHLSLAERAARYRQLLTGRRTVILLDNAFTEDQIRPLLPDSPRCLTLITSRRVLAGLPAAQHLQLGPFSEPDAIQLLRHTAGAQRIDADPDTAAAIAQAVGYLPLALGLVASRINANLDWMLADHLARLAERREQLRLDDGVELALDLSYHALHPRLRRLVRLLALHWTGNLDAHAAAALADTDLDTAQRQLDELVACNLLQQTVARRYHFHDVVGVYANARATDEERPVARHDALSRLLDWCLHTTSLAMDAAYPFEQHRRSKVATMSTPVPPVGDPAAARAWLGAEHQNLTAAVGHAARHGWPDHACRLAMTLNRHLDTCSHYDDGAVVHGHALDAARQLGDRDAEGRALLNLSGVSWRRGRYTEALELGRQALANRRELGDRSGEGQALGNLGVVCSQLGRIRDAIGYGVQALETFREIGDRVNESIALTNLGGDYERIGLYQEAVDCELRSLAISQEAGDRDSEAGSFANLGLDYAGLRRYHEAIDSCRRSIDLFREVGNAAGECYASTQLGRVYTRLGRHREAIELHDHAAGIAGRVSYPSLEAEVRNNLGDALRAIGRFEDARRHHEAALGLTTGRERYDQARALDGIADSLLRLGRPDQARRRWQEALAIYAGMGVPEAGQVRARLEGLQAR